MSKLATQKSTADKWMQEAIREHGEFVRLFKSAKDRALNCGMFFLSAKSCFDHGDWENYLTGYSHKVSMRTVRFYMSFAEEAIEWAKQENPKLLGLDKLSAAAREMILQSPKGLVALCRELRLMRKFGEYDEVKYAKRKLLGDSGQIEFEFSKVFATLEVLSHFGDDKYQFIYPEGKDPDEYLTEVETALESSLTRVRQFKQGKVIDA